MHEQDFELLTPRLRLRTPFIEDAEALQFIVADSRVALTTASIPHPYPENGALAFIEQARRIGGPDRRNLAMTLKSTNELIGMAGFVGSGTEAELAYMVAPQHWGQGYATEATSRLIAYLFGETGFSSVLARAMTANPASEEVLRKAGLHWEREAEVELPIRGGMVATSFWRLDRDRVC
jgi:RimJ/RimL family protein N-acetyltransferase